MALLDALIIILAFGGRATCRSNLASRATANNADTSLTLIYQNNLNLTDDANHASAIILGSMMRSGASPACEAIGEKLLSRATIEASKSDFLQQLSYQAYAGRADSVQGYLIDNGTVSVVLGLDMAFFPSTPAPAVPLPVLCTQSSKGNQSFNSAGTSTNEISVSSGGNTYVGFRNQKSFRFLGIPYAEPPKRFEYPVLYARTGETLQATSYGSQCVQIGSNGSEDCLFLNIQTPYIPKAGSKENLRPVLFWIHGGGFTGGSGSASDSDGGQLASREDIVTVSINYRLVTLGFLAVPDTNITGNYGIADQNLALQWVIKNIENFGGDPNRITLNGESAGACSVRVHLGSPLAIGKFRSAIAMSNLGGGQDLGLGGNYATQYSLYPTIQESFNLSSELFTEANCTEGDNNAKVNCLRGIDANTLVNLNTVARYVVQDGKYVNTPELIVSRQNDNTAHVPVLWGIVADDGASFSTFPNTTVVNELAGIQASLAIDANNAESVMSSGLFPLFNTGNITLDAFNVSARIATDNQFRCIDQASAFAGAKTGAFPVVYYYQNERTLSPGGYDPNNLGGPPKSDQFPFGNPNLPYFRLHGSDMGAQFGYVPFLREPADLFALQMSMAYYSEFIRSGQPNPSADYLRVRGYNNILDAMTQTGPWEPVKDENGPIRLLDWPGRSSDFIDKPQCAFLNYSITYYMDH